MTDIARKGHWSQLYECVICSLLMWQPFNNWANPTYGILLNSVHYALFSPQIVGTCRPGHAWALPRLFSENLSWRTVVRHIPEKNWRSHWKCANDTHEMSALDQSTASISHIRHYWVLPWATGPLTLLESIAKVPDQQVAKTGKLSIFWLPSFFFLSSLTREYC